MSLPYLASDSDTRFETGVRPNTLPSALGLMMGCWPLVGRVHFTVSERPPSDTQVGAENRPSQRTERAGKHPFIPRTPGSPASTNRQPPLAADPWPEQEWLRKHRTEYRGQWVALDGSQLISHGYDGKRVFLEAKAAGVRSPFLAHIEEEALPFGGW